MQQAPSVTVKDLLVASGVGQFGPGTGWRIYVGKDPFEPDSVITVRDSPGRNPHPALLLDFPSIQVTVRAAQGDYRGAYGKAVEVKNTLLGLPSQDLGGDRWLSVTMAGDIQSIGWDDRNRPILSLNFNLIIEPTVGTNRVAV